MKMTGRVDEVERLSKDSAGALPCGFRREMYQKNNGQPKHKAGTTEALSKRSVYDLDKIAVRSRGEEYT